MFLLCPRKLNLIRVNPFHKWALLFPFKNGSRTGKSQGANRKAFKTSNQRLGIRDQSPLRGSTGPVRGQRLF